MLVRTPVSRTSAALVGGLLTALLAAGCGQGDDPSVATTSTSTTSAAPPSASAARARPPTHAVLI
ncbi:hypothetical protein JNW91_05310, partial [Micromonospora sp. STR1_7]|nr:hypothetical protein [Micromonospora parastrephiae]